MLEAIRAAWNQWFGRVRTGRAQAANACETRLLNNPRIAETVVPEFLRAHPDGDDESTHGERRSISAHPVPYDENLLERARTQWQFGDWQSLAQLTSDTLQHHPDRAKLALLAAAGRLQAGQDAEGRQYIRLAQDWGVGKKLVSQILIAGVHNSIGRAAAIGNQQHRALQHFENAIAIGTPGSDAKMLTQARTGEQLSQLGLPTPEGYLIVGAGGTAPMPAKLPPLSKSIEALTDTLKQQKTELDAQLKRHADELISVRKSLDSAVKKEISNATKQIEAFISIQTYLTTGGGLSEFHGFPISPDIGLFLIERIRERRYDIAIEFGSGTSTALLAKAMQMTKRDGASSVYSVTDEEHSWLVCSFEHNLDYLHKTQGLLESQKLSDLVGLNHTPLIDWQDKTGRYLYYDCDEKLIAVAKQLSCGPKRLLVLIDGPPGATCINSRYPAVPSVFKHLFQHKIDVVLDDANRSEELAVINLWREFWKENLIDVVEGTAVSEKGLYWARNYHGL